MPIRYQPSATPDTYAKTEQNQIWHMLLCFGKKMEVYGCTYLLR
jgi:hypothetical protein